MRAFRWIFAALMVVSWLCPRLLADAPSTHPSGIESISYRGTGCPEGSVAANLAPDAQTMTLIFSSFAVDTSTRSGRPMRKVCAINIAMRTEPGWQFTLFGVDVRGYANIQAGAVGVQQVLHSFGEGDGQSIGRQQLIGPFDNNFSSHSELPLAAVEWSPCDSGRHRRFHLRASITVRPRLGFRDSDGEQDDAGKGPSFPYGYMTVDSIDGGMVQQYQVAWRRCTGR